MLCSYILKHNIPYMRLLSFSPVVIALIIFGIVPAKAQNAAQLYQQEVEKAIAAIDKQSRDGSPVTKPALRSTGSAMYDRAANLLIQFTVGLRNEAVKANWQDMLSDGLAEDDYSFLANPKLVEHKYLRLMQWRIEQQRHLAVFEQTVDDFQTGMQELHSQYGEETKVFASPYVDKMAVQYPPSIRKLCVNFTRLIEYAHLNAAQIRPAPHGLIAMKTQEETVKVLNMIKDLAEAINQIQNLVE